MRLRRRQNPKWRQGLLLPTDQLRDLINKPALSQRSRLHLILAAAGNAPISVTEIKRIATEAGLHEIATWNVTDALNKSKGSAARVSNGWVLTSLGKSQVEEEFKLSFQKNKPVPVLDKLRKATSSISNADTVAYVDESLSCFEAGFYRASVVLSWMGAISLIQDYVLNKKLSEFNAEALRRNTKWKPITTKDGFGRMDEGEFLDILADPSVAVFGKNVKEELKNHCLALRNACGHPNSLKIAEQRVASHLEVLVLNIFARF
jgi:hypothetical protein